MVVGRIYGVVGLTGFSDKKMSGLLLGPQKSGRDNGVVVWRGSTVYTISFFFFQDFATRPFFDTNHELKYFH